jgi:hypothetical protein
VADLNTVFILPDAPWNAKQQSFCSGVIFARDFAAHEILALDLSSKPE